MGEFMGIKALLRGIGMVSGLSINMVKSKLYGVGIREKFMQDASLFLSCKRDKVPFKLLGIYVDDNPRRIDACT